MKLGGGKEWFTAAELAELALPGLPKSKRKVNERAQAEGWALRFGADGAQLARARSGRGGGLEYHMDVLPIAARSALVARGVAIVADVSDAPETRSARLWREFEQMSAKAQAEAKRRARVIAMVDAYVAQGLNVSAAVPIAATRHEVAASTLWSWLSLIDGAPATDRLPLLAPRHRGGGKEAEVDPEVWERYRSYYLRDSKPTFQEAYDEAAKVAQLLGVEMPHPRTLRRKYDREVNPLVTVLCRSGADALRQTLPPQRRSVAHMHAMELVNIDGHRWDVFVRWPDGEIARPVMIAIQDVYSRKMLAWSIGRTESAIGTRMALARLFDKYGIPGGILMDNGRAFASKWITGGAKNRFRFKVRDEEPLGIITALGIKLIWAQPYRGQSKPIERAFGTLTRLARRPEFEGAYTGNSPHAKPESYGSAAVPFDQFVEVIEAGIAEYNAAPGRRTETARGVHSFDEVFDASYAVSPIGKATPEQMRMALLAADDRPTNRTTGEIQLFGNRYWAPELAQIAGERVTVRFDPDDLHAPLHVYRREGAYFCTAPVFGAEGFDSAEAASRRSRLERDLRKRVRAMVEAEDLLAADELAGMAQRIAPEQPLPPAGVVRPVRHQGHTAAALKTASQRAVSARQAAADPSIFDDMAAGIQRLRAVK